LTSFIDMVFGNREDFTSRTPVAFCAREYSFAPAVGGNSILRSWHSCSFLLSSL
jgi:hypothetical protein